MHSDGIDSVILFASFLVYSNLQKYSKKSVKRKPKCILNIKNFSFNLENVKNTRRKKKRQKYLNYHKNDRM